MGNSDIWMPFYIGDYVRDTTGLSTKQHGCYLLLLMHYWVQKYLTDEMEELLMICRLQPEEKQELEKVLKRFFQHEDGRYVQKRIEQELQRAANIRERNQKNARSRWGNAKSVRKPSQTDAKSKPKRCSSQSQSQSQSNTHLEDSTDSKDSVGTNRATKETDPRIKKLIDSYYEHFVFRCGFPPTVNGSAWGKIFKRLLRHCSEETIHVVMTDFFAYEKRTRFSIYDFERSFDNVYKRLLDLQNREQK